MKTTARDFELFQKYSDKWQRDLSLTNWKIYYSHTKLDDSYADCTWSMEDSVGFIRLNTSWSTERPKTPHELDKLALHEMMHLLFGEYECLATDRYATEKAIDIASHAIIRRLEYILCK